jgi:membrane protease YdiL (CAAX protease family)
MAIGGGDGGRSSARRAMREEPSPPAERSSVLPLEVPKREPREMATRGERAPAPWGPWATVGFGVLIVALWSFTQVFAATVIIGGTVKPSDLALGWIFARATIVSAPLLVGASVLLARVRRGVGVAAYLGLTWPRVSDALRWCLILLALLVAMASLSLALGKSVAEPMLPVFRTAGSLPIFLIALVVAAPLAEEFLFRGFIFKGLLASRLGPTGAIALTALAWAALHIQYDLFGIACVVACGIFLGLVRWRTGSLWLCVLLHALVNAIATIEMMIFISTE